MSLSFNNLKEVLLLEDQVVTTDGELKALSEVEAWASLNFLKGMKFEKVEFHSPSVDVLQNWMQRIENYEQQFLADPDYIDVEACVWDEWSSDGEKKQIQCHRKQKSIHQTLSKSAAVPVLGAPLQLDAQAITALKNEIKNQSTEDVLLRMQSILVEFQEAKDSIDSESWARLVADLVCVSLETANLQKAVALAEFHRDAFKEIWKDEARSLRLLSSFEINLSVVDSWYRIFNSLTNRRLVDFLKIFLSTKAGPQILYLMNRRSKDHPSEFIEICFQESRDVQRLLMQWLHPYFQAKHYSQALELLFQCIRTQDDRQLANHWIRALMTSYQTQAMRDLSNFFRPNRLWNRIIKREKMLTVSEQRRFVSAVAEHPTRETLQLLREIKPFIRGGVGDEVEKIISNYGGKLAS